ncbi:hypothetical protein [Stenotrophomonas sp.]|uniref:hypothetical protein n=1 Tax=Stenotrophomonas sp. TaxID=69392 RepID=UPI0028AF7D5F|nr:hypothetical protein [Stenotrophomonas sp.]
MDAIPSPTVVVEKTRIEAGIARTFGIAPQAFEGVARSILRGFTGTSALHPKGYNGTRGWADGSAAVREALIPEGWHPEDPQNQPRVVSSKRRVAITVSSGSPQTGVAERTPQTRNDKGSQTSSSVNFNAKQLEMFPVNDQVSNIRPMESGQALWIFLYYIDPENRELRYELSRPTAMSEHDKVNEWSIRYIFPPLKFDAEFEVDDRSDAQDVTPDIDITVTPKK